MRKIRVYVSDDHTGGSGIFQPSYKYVQGNDNRKNREAAGEHE
jgi:hypothetical protein